jgi:hypothetical protein
MPAYTYTLLYIYIYAVGGVVQPHVGVKIQENHVRSVRVIPVYVVRIVIVVTRFTTLVLSTVVCSDV